METGLILQFPSLPEIPIIIDEINDNLDLPELSQPALTFSADVILPAVSERKLALKRKKQRQNGCGSKFQSIVN